LGIPISQVIVTSTKEKKHSCHGLIQYKNCSNYNQQLKGYKSVLNGIASEFLAFGVVLNGDRPVRFLAITLCCHQAAEVLSHLTPSFAKQTIRTNQQCKL
jgi:hypothetical protein